MQSDIFPERPEKYPYGLEQVIVEEYCKWTERKGFGHISSKQIEVFREIIFGFLTAKEGEITVIPPMMGLGKSTLLFVFCKVQNVLNQGFGAIVVKERLEDIKRFSEQIGDIDDDYNELEIAYPWQGFTKELCKLGLSDYEAIRCASCDEQNCDIKHA